MMLQLMPKEKEKLIESHIASKIVHLSSKIFAFLFSNTIQINVRLAIHHSDFPLERSPKPLQEIVSIPTTLLSETQSILASPNNLCHNANLQQVIIMNLPACHQPCKGLEFRWNFGLPNEVCQKKGSQISGNKEAFQNELTKNMPNGVAYKKTCEMMSRTKFSYVGRWKINTHGLQLA